jgi:serine/threonine protein phosphatase 1
MTNFLNRLFRGGQKTDGEDSGASRRRIAATSEPAAIYAIGDIHGRLDLLQAMEQQVLADGAGIAGEKWIVTLGDHIDRGPQSAGVIDHLAASLPAGWRRFSLCGNHELEMLGFIARPSSAAGWLEFGGEQTLLSYGMPSAQVLERNLRRDRWRQLIDYWIPAEHIAWLENLPILIETPRYLFVHAGLVPERRLADQDDLDLVGYRDDFVHDFAEFGKTVVHGHQVRRTPLMTPTRIGLDTGAYATGLLTAVKLVTGEPPVLLTASQRPGG